MSLDSKTPSLEAIQYQGESKLFKELIEVFEKLALLDKIDQKALNDSKFNQVVKTNTGLDVKLVLGGYMAAYTFLPSFGINNATTYGARGAFKDEFNKMQYSTVRKLGNKESYDGVVDLKNSKVGGVFSEMKLEIYLGTYFFGKTSRLTPRQTAAVILHEIGHLFTHFETLSDFMTATITVATALKEISGEKIMEKRLKILNGLRHDLKLPEIDDASLVSKADNQIELATITLREYLINSPASRFGSQNYDVRSCEQLCDQFAARHGAARDLALALSNFNMGWRPSRLIHLTSQFLYFVAFVAAMIAAPIAVTIVTLVHLIIPGLDRDMYDPPFLRVERMRKDMIQILKDPNLPPEHRNTVLTDIEFLEAYAGDEEQYRSIFMFLWTTISTRRRKEYDRKKFQLEIEKLLNNELFVSANQLKSMS